MDRSGPSRMDRHHVGWHSSTSRGRVAGAPSVFDVSQRGDVQLLKKRAIGLGSVLFISFAAMSPLTGQLGNVPIAIGLGNGIGAPAGFEIGIVALALFAVGYVKLMNRGALLRRLLLVHQPRAWPGRSAWGPAGRPSSPMRSSCARSSALRYFGNITIQQFFHFGVPCPSWPSALSP